MRTNATELADKNMKLNKQLKEKEQELYLARNEVHSKTEYIQEQRDIIKQLERECESLKEHKMNIETKLDGMISELNFIKINYKEGHTLEEFCQNFKIALISKLEQMGAIYDPTLENEWNPSGNNTTDKKKFFAFKKSDVPTEREILNSLDSVRRTLSGYMAEIGDLKNLSFNIQKIEGLRYRDAFSDLIRGILVVKGLNNANI